MVGRNEGRTMVGRSADEVLADLKDVGAVGGVKQSSEVLVMRPEVQVLRAAPVGPVRTSRGVEVLARVQEALRGAAVALERAAEDLGELRAEMTLDEGSPVEVGEQPAPRPTEVDVVPPAPESVEPEGVEAEGDAYQRAREAALRKIRGEDVRGEAPPEDEDDVPFVGQTRVVPEGSRDEAVSIGSLGTIKPSFPAEG